MEPADRKKVYSKRKKSGLCPRCGQKIKKSSKYKMCDDCREYFRTYNRDFSDAIQEVRRERYQQRKDKNCCPRCNTFVGKKAKNAICTKCLKKQYKYNYGKSRPSKKK